MGLKTAVVGAGHLGKIHASKLRTLEEFELVVVVDPDESARQAAAEQFNVAVDADHRPWLDRVDAVIVASPTTHHHAAARDFLEAGVHALVEKPLASSVDEATDLVETARRSQTALQVGHVERFNPAWTAARPHLQRPVHIECVREGMFTLRSTDIGVVHDLMIHDIDLTLSLVHSPLVDVEADGTALLGAHEDTAYARLQFADGCTAVLSASRVSPTTSRQMRVRTDGTIATIDFNTKQATLLDLDPRVRDGGLGVERMSTAERAEWKSRLTTELVVRRELTVEPADAITAELKDFATAIRRGRRPTVAGVDALESLRVAQRILEAVAASRDEAKRSRRTATIPAPHWMKSHIALSARRHAG